MLAREHGLAGFSLRDIADRVGMRPPSLYWYFDAKHAIYDAMFEEGNRELQTRLRGLPERDDPRQALRDVARLFVEFSAEEPARYQLLFLRTLPDFEPSAASYAVASEIVTEARERLAGAGLAGPRNFDLWTALVSGLAAQQLANDPGGDRWLSLIDESVDMFADHVLPAPTQRRRR